MDLSVPRTAAKSCKAGVAAVDRVSQVLGAPDAIAGTRRMAAAGERNRNELFSRNCLPACVGCTTVGAAWKFAVSLKPDCEGGVTSCRCDKVSKSVPERQAFEILRGRASGLRATVARSLRRRQASFCEGYLR